MKFVTTSNILSERRKVVTYARIVCNHRYQKEEVSHTRVAVEENLINCPFGCGSPTAGLILITIKLLLNSVISIPHARWVTIDISHYYVSEYFNEEKRVYENRARELPRRRNRALHFKRHREG